MKTPFAICTAALLVLLASPVGHAENLMQNGDFEEPAVKMRTPKDSGADPVNGGVKSLWQSFTATSNATGGSVIAGLTNEIAHGGAQSLFVKFDDVSSSYQNATLKTALVPVMQSMSYRIGLWGRVGKINPLIMGDRQTFMKIQVDFLKDDGTTLVGDPEYRIQAIPGSKNHPLLFTADKWNEYYTEINTPVEAAFLILKLSFESGSTPGKISGIIFFDDFTIQGEPSMLKTPKPMPAETPEPDPAAPVTTGSSNN